MPVDIDSGNCFMNLINGQYNRFPIPASLGVRKVLPNLFNIPLHPLRGLGLGVNKIFNNPFTVASQPNLAGRKPWDAVEYNEALLLRVDVPELSKDGTSNVSVEDKTTVVKNMIIISVDTDWCKSLEHGVGELSNEATKVFMQANCLMNREVLPSLLQQLILRHNSLLSKFRCIELHEDEFPNEILWIREAFRIFIWFWKEL
ncbi:hypothetical protein SUGI_1492640 [Cryptomeria japonica]|uniref:Uncharacterized protein n=1 Tax=Cryptomeria japonica TaxID=3369 RepID=A0AAD3RRM8_CRYJA|nr:hypothetical protein SUGI_1492640 [Cryptomeria japonica]